MRTCGLISVCVRAFALTLYHLCLPPPPPPSLGQTHPDIGNRTAALITMPKGRYQYLRKLLPLLANQSEDCLTLNIYVPGSGKFGARSVLFTMGVVGG